MLWGEMEKYRASSKVSVKDYKNSRPYSNVQPSEQRTSCPIAKAVKQIKIERANYKVQGEGNAGMAGLNLCKNEGFLLLGGGWWFRERR